MRGNQFNHTFRCEQGGIDVNMCINETRQSIHAVCAKALLCISISICPERNHPAILDTNCATNDLIAVNINNSDI